MDIKNFAIILLSSILMSACYDGGMTPQERCALDASCSGGFQEPASKTRFANEEDLISLQNLETRVIVHCKTTQTELAETCAQAFEKQGFTRFRDIPYKTADYDFLKKDTYPTRRWRNGERTPRW